MRRLNINYYKNEMPYGNFSEREFMNNFGMANHAVFGTRREFDVVNDVISLIYKESIDKLNTPLKRKELDDLNILVVEDEKINFMVINLLMKDKVKNIDRAINGLEAIELVRNNLYDVVFMDINMPLMGGIEATRIIKKMQPDLPIIAQTAFTSLDDKNIFIEAGCDDILLKPIKKELLFGLLEKHGTK
jgi:CheY-like chemotaxis protein